MGRRFLAGLFVFLLTCHTSYAGILEPLVGCRCARVRATFIPPSKYASVVMYPPGSACNRMEVIITLKEKGTRVCVSPEAKWVQNLVRRIKSTNSKVCSCSCEELKSAMALEGKGCMVHPSQM